MAGRAREMGLGSLAVVSLAEARIKAREQRQLRDKGIDPLDARNAARGTVTQITFEKCAAAYVAAHKAEWSAKHAAQYEETLDRANAIIGKMPVASVDTAAVLKVLSPLWESTNETASRLRGRIENVLDSAKAAGYRSGENPARWKGHLKLLLAAPIKVQRDKKKNLAAMPWQDVPAFMGELRAHDKMVARALEFTILTAARSREVRGARWCEIDLAMKTWTVPAGRMKARKEHAVPLSGRALELIGTNGGAHELLFPGLTENNLLGYLRSMREVITVHGFRSSFRDWAGDETNYPRNVVERCLAHETGGKTEKSYARSNLLERRRPLMNDWSTFCGKISTPGEVVPLRMSRK